MPYPINKTDGTKLVTLKDGVVDITTTDLALFGKGYAGFGERLNENFVKLLENFANNSAPVNKIQGQLWYDTVANQLKIWNGSKFKAVGSSNLGSTQPTNSNTGDMWFDTNNSQLYVYNGTNWTLIGPTSVAGSGVTQVSSESIRDSLGVNKSILKMITNDLVVAIVSAEPFVPQTPINGFATIYKGITLSTNISNNKFVGTASNADQLAGIAAANYLRSDENDATTGAFWILNDSGLNIGAGSDLTLSIVGDNAEIRNNTSNGNMEFYVNDGGVDTKAMYIDGSDGTVYIKNLQVTGSSVVINTETLSIEDNIIELNRNISSAFAMPNYTGLKVNRGETSSPTEQDLYWVWDETFADDGTTTYGNSGGAWTAFKSGGRDNELSAPTLVDIRANIVHATSTSAQYADLAERYETDQPLEVGDVVILGGSKEITKSTVDLDDRVFGVISEKPAFLMNSDAGNNDSHPMVALKGRTRVKLKGIGNAGDRIVASEEAGIARVANLAECTAFNVLGRLLCDKYSIETELCECIIGVK